MNKNSFKEGAKKTAVVLGTLGAAGLAAGCTPQSVARDVFSASYGASNWFKQYDAEWNRLQAGNGVNYDDTSSKDGGYDYDLNQEGKGKKNQLDEGGKDQYKINKERDFTCADVHNEDESFPIVQVLGMPKSVHESRVFSVENVNAKYNEKYVNTIGGGSETMFAEEGTLRAGRPNNIETEGLVTSVENNGFTVFALQEGWIDIPSKGDRILLRERQDHMHIVAIRGNFAGKNAERLGLELHCLVPDHAQEQVFDRGTYISEGALKQLAEAAQSPYDLEGKKTDNCGGPGCSELTVTAYDPNNETIDVLTQRGVEGDWNPLMSNWR